MKNILLSILLLFANVLLVFHDVIDHDHIADILIPETHAHSDNIDNHSHDCSHNHSKGLWDLLKHLSGDENHHHHSESHFHLEDDLLISARQNNFKTNQVKVKDIAKPILVLSNLLTENLFEQEEPEIFIEQNERVSAQIYQKCSSLRGPPFMG